MRPVSPEYLEALRGSHKMVADARVLTTFQTGVDPDGTEIPIISGDVSQDATASVRATLDLTTDGTRMWSNMPSGLLTPYGNEIFVRRGIDFGDGTREWVSQGYFGIYDIDQKGGNLNNPITITAYDRMKGIADARLVAPIQFPAGLLLGDIVLQLVTEVYPLATIEWDDTTDADVLTRSLVAEEDRYEFLNDLVTSRGKIWYWDYRGVLVIKDVPDPTVSVYNVNSGAGGVMVDMARSISREGVYNAVVVMGEGADTVQPVRVVVTDDNPLSPTYWEGRFGKVPRFYSSPFITEESQAVRAGNSLLLQSKGLPYNVDFTTIVNAALEPFDPVNIHTTEGDEIHVIETLVTPLVAADAQTATTREQSLIALTV